MIATFSLKELRKKGGAGSGNFAHSGRPGIVGGSGPSFSISATSERVWTGKKHEGTTELTKNEQGTIGEAVAMAHLSERYGVPFSTLNSVGNNAPIDVAGDHQAVEVKTGIAVNESHSQRWRATIGQPGKAEQKLIAQMTPAEKRSYNDYKKEQILQRKQSMLLDMSREANAPIAGKTVGVILNADGTHADVFEFTGFHLTLSWSQYATEQYYVGSYEVK